MMNVPSDFEIKLSQIAEIMETTLVRLIASHAGGPATRLNQAMRYAALGGGKRFRPFLLIESAAMLGVQVTDAVTAAAAVECIHGYSLVHDDLPAMDDDDLRRGKPTVHKAFDESTAILAGDALLTLAFEILALPEAHPDPRVRIELVRELASASGATGMAGGQMLDLDCGDTERSRTGIEQLQAMKTGALIASSCRMGGMLGSPLAEDIAALDAYGRAIGWAFQISDDLLDAEGDSEAVGKATGKDGHKNKATIVGLVGPAAARKELDELVVNAEKALERFGAKARLLAAAARFMASRRS
jgi:farnesyl diphosphate synthase